MLGLSISGGGGGLRQTPVQVMIHHMRSRRIRKGIVKVVQTGVQIELKARRRRHLHLPLLLICSRQTHRRPILPPPVRVIRDGVWVSQRTKSVLEDGGQVRVTRVYDLPHILDELGYGNVGGAVDEVLQDAVDPGRCCSVFHGRRRERGYSRSRKKRS